MSVGFVSLEDFSVHHPEQQTVFLIVNGIVVDISAVNNLADAAAVEDRLVVAGDDLGDGHVVTALHHPSGNARGIDGRMIGGYDLSLAIWSRLIYTKFGDGSR